MTGLLGALVIIFAPHKALCDRNEDQQIEALKTVMNVSYKQFGIEENINNYIKNLIPDDYKKYAAHVAPIVDGISKKRVELKWEF